MREGQKGKFGIVVDREWDGNFQLGTVFNHTELETYLSLFLFKWIISIGFIDRYEGDVYE